MQKILKIFLPAITLMVISLAGICLAQEATDTATTVDQQAVQTATEEPAITAQDLGVSEPTLLSDSKFYFLKNWKNTIQSIFTFGQVKKAELNLKIASEKLLEARKLSEKTDNPQILDKAAEIYNKQVEKIGTNIAKFKGTATSSEKISKFLDKYTKQQILQEQILDKLETKVPTSTMEKIQQAREKNLEKFGQVMQKLEDKDKIQQRLEKGLENLKENDLKPIIKLEILKKLEDKFPTSTIQQLQQVKTGVLQKLNDKLQSMPAQAQQKIENYLEKAQGTIEKKQELINEIKNSLPEGSTLKQKIDIIKEDLRQKATGATIRKDCICIEQYNPVCGADGKTYGNPCKAKCLNIAIVSQGPCGGKTTTTQNVVGGDKDEHGCIGSAGYSWCEYKQKCLRIWEETCPTSSTSVSAWTIYKDDDFEVEFSYPSFWKGVQKYPFDEKVGKWRSEYKTLKIGYNLNQTGISIIITPNINSSVDDLLPCKDKASDIIITKCEKININDIQFKRADFSGTPVKNHIDLMTVQNGKLYSIQLIPGDIGEKDTTYIINSIIIK